jgi:hypothetical protein
LLIGDSLYDTDTAYRWLDIARRINRSKLPVRLLMAGDNPWSKQLKATGAVHVLPDLHNFSLVECAQAAGSDGVMSLVDNPGSDWLAPALADQLNLPLFATPNLLASEIGATALTSLPFTLSLA